MQCVHVAGTAVKPPSSYLLCIARGTTTSAGGILDAGAFLPPFATLGNRSLWLNHFHSRSAGNHIDDIACPYTNLCLGSKRALPQLGSCCSGSACTLLTSLFLLHDIAPTRTRVHYPSCKHQSLSRPLSLPLPKSHS